MAGLSQVRHSHLSIPHKRGLIFRALPMARCGYTAMQRQQKTADASRAQVWFGKNIFFLAFFAGFNPGWT